MKENSKDGSIIYSESWCVFKTAKLKDVGFEHLKVSHEYNFVDPQTAIYTRQVDRIGSWRNGETRNLGNGQASLEAVLSGILVAP